MSDEDTPNKAARVDESENGELDHGYSFDDTIDLHVSLPRELCHKLGHALCIEDFERAIFLACCGEVGRWEIRHKTQLPTTYPSGYKLPSGAVGDNPVPKPSEADWHPDLRIENDSDR